MPRVECPKCSAWLAVDDQAIGELTECRYCHAVFPAVELGRAASVGPNTPFVLADFFTESYFPYDPAEQLAVILQAERRVRIPAIGMIVSGTIGICASIITACAVLVTHIDKWRPDVYLLFINLGLCIAAGFLQFMMVAAGRALRRLENRALCSFGASVGIAGMACCGLYGIVTVAGFIFGTWMFIALGSREVKHAMRWKRNERDENHREQ